MYQIIIMIKEAQNHTGSLQSLGIKMKIHKLEKDRSLIDPNFGGYKLSLDGVVSNTVALEEEQGPSHRHPGEGFHQTCSSGFAHQARGSTAFYTPSCLVNITILLGTLGGRGCTGWGMVGNDGEWWGMVGNDWEWSGMVGNGGE